ncbi:tyrosine-type recombinase/integrase [Thermomonas sp.]|uniref:tyrosine-type recombinase/integrase n=1 Tax=Thermomonas sp. TaxID=1971895 RepID=UPI002487579A|nr:tyrosine-type recombinase/integrase [Thermomonas sp.]MDI1252772.1 tyrosine-type recombinase/integrase [Thermomonas sp.]
MATWPELRGLYLDHLRSLGRSRFTVAAYGLWLQRFLEFCEHEAIVSPAAFTSTHLERFRQHMCWAPRVNGELYSEHTVDMALRSVRAMFTWATKRERLLINPAEHLLLARVPSATRCRPLPRDEVAQLLATPDDSTPSGLRDRAVLETLYSTGIRRLECELLDLADLDFDRRTLHIHGKGSVDRLVPVGESLAALLDRYLNEARGALLRSGFEPRWQRKHPHIEQPNMHEQALFLSLRGMRYRAESIYLMVTSTARRAKLEHISTHGLRHACATHLLEAGADFRAVQKLMGHVVPQSTQTYTRISRQELRRVHLETHPRGRRITPPFDVDTV